MTAQRFEIGDVVPLTWTLTLDDVPTDATVVLTLTLPDGTTTTPSVTHDSTGAYSAEVTATLNGLHSYRWTATGAVVAAETGTFRVGGAVTLAEAKDHLKFTTAVNEDELLRFIDAAEAAISRLIGPLVPTATTEKLDGNGESLILRNMRAVSLTSVAYADGTAVDVDDLDLDTQTGIIYWNYNTAGTFTCGRRNVTVTYLAGFGIVPEDLRQAVLEMVRHLWDTQRPAKQGNRQSNPEDVPVAGAYSTWPPRVQELVAPFVIPAIA